MLSVSFCSKMITLRGLHSTCVYIVSKLEGCKQFGNIIRDFHLLCLTVMKRNKKSSEVTCFSVLLCGSVGKLKENGREAFCKIVIIKTFSL
jgi:hypothetical protein